MSTQAFPTVRFWILTSSKKSYSHALVPIPSLMTLEAVLLHVQLIPTTETVSARCCLADRNYGQKNSFEEKVALPVERPLKN